MAGKPNDKWMATMLKKHGSKEAVSDYMRIRAAKGGKSVKNYDPITGRALKGFAITGNAAAAGAKGGKNRWKGKK